MAVEIASEKGWHNLWLECDSSLVVSAFENHLLIPWWLRNRWVSCMMLTTHMRFFYSNLLRRKCLWWQTYFHSYLQSGIYLVGHNPWFYFRRVFSNMNNLSNFRFEWLPMDFGLVPQCLVFFIIFIYLYIGITEYQIRINYYWSTVMDEERKINLTDLSWKLFDIPQKKLLNLVIGLNSNDI